MYVPRSSAFLTAALLCASLAAAQSSPSPSTATKDVPTPTSFVGCLEQSQRTAIAPESGSFVLSSPTLAPSAAVKGTPDDPASNARAAIPPADAGDTGRAEGKIAGTYVLEGSKTELAKHIGHKVEVTGILKPAAPAAATTSPATGAPTPSAVPHLQVTAIKMVSASCSGN